MTSRKTLQAIVSEMVSQLNDDILHCGWLCQIVRLQNPAFTDRKCWDYDVNAVLLLHRERTIVVGDTLDIEGMICIQPWPDYLFSISASGDLTDGLRTERKG